MKHGSHWAYCHGCRCDVCRISHAAYVKRYRCRGYGDFHDRQQWRPTTEATVLVRDLIARGMTPNVIATNTGVSLSAVQRLKRGGETTWTRTYIVDALETCCVTSLPGGVWVKPDKARELIVATMLKGYSLAAIQRATGVDKTTLSAIRDRTQPSIRFVTYEKLRRAEALPDHLIARGAGLRARRVAFRLMGTVT